MMTANIGNLERMGRLVLGVAIMVYFFGFTQSNVRWFGLIGLVLAATALIRFCPIWAVLGISTIKK